MVSSTLSGLSLPFLPFWVETEQNDFGGLFYRKVEVIHLIYQKGVRTGLVGLVRWGIERLGCNCEFVRRSLKSCEKVGALPNREGNPGGHKVNGQYSVSMIPLTRIQSLSTFSKLVVYDYKVGLLREPILRKIHSFPNIYRSASPMLSVHMPTQYPLQSLS